MKSTGRASWLRPGKRTYLFILMGCVLVIVAARAIRGENTHPAPQDTTRVDSEASTQTGSVQVGIDSSTLLDEFHLPDPENPLYLDAGIQNLEYVEITEDNVTELADKFRREGDEQLTGLQSASLREAIATHLLAYKFGGTERILDDNLRAPYAMREEAVEGNLDVLTRFCLLPGETPPTDPYDIMVLLIERNYGGVDGSGYANVFDEIAPSASSITVRSGTEMPPAIYDTVSARGVIRTHPSITFEETPDSVLQSSGQLTCMDIRVVAANSEGTKYSHLRRFYWSPKFENWLPMEVVSLCVESRPADQFF